MEPNILGLTPTGSPRAAALSTMVVLRSVMLSAMLAPRVVVLGPGSLDMRLLTAKLAARAGLETSLFVGGATARSNSAAAWLQPGLSHGGPLGFRAELRPRVPTNAAVVPF